MPILSAFESVDAILAPVADAVVLVKKLADALHGADAKATICSILDELAASREKTLELLNENNRLKVEVETLKKEIAELRTSHLQAGHYEIMELEPGVRMGVLKESFKQTGDPHWACPKCLANGMVGEVQLAQDDGFLPRGAWNKRDLECLQCGARFAIDREAFEMKWPIEA